MRDYLKNDFDVVFCPDGFVDRGNRQLGKDLRPKDAISHRASCLYTAGYLYLPHRWTSMAETNPSVPPPYPWTVDANRPQDIAQTASDTPMLLMLADHAATDDVAPNWKIQGNHANVPVRGVAFALLPALSASDPNTFPLGSNAVRIDCKVEWTPFTNAKVRWHSTHCTPSLCTQAWGMFWW